MLSKKPKEEVGFVETELGCSRHEWNLGWGGSSSRVEVPVKCKSECSVEEVEPFGWDKFP